MKMILVKIKMKQKILMRLNNINQKIYKNIREIMTITIHKKIIIDNKMIMQILMESKINLKFIIHNKMSMTKISKIMMESIMNMKLIKLMMDNSININNQITKIDNMELMIRIKYLITIKKLLTIKAKSIMAKQLMKIKNLKFQLHQIKKTR